MRHAEAKMNLPSLMEMYAGNSAQSQQFQLNGSKLNITIMFKPTHDKYDTSMRLDDSGKAEFLPCFSYDLLMALQYALNFTYELKLTDHWGYFDKEKKKWHGMIKDLVTGNADFGLSGTADILERREAVEFNIPVYELRFLAVFLQPNLRRDSYALFKPFNKYVWVLLLAFLIIFPLAIIGIRLGREGAGLQQSLSNSENLTVGAEQNLLSVFWVVHFMCAKSVHWISARVSIMTIIICGFLFGLVLNATYTAVLFSFLSLPLKSFVTIEDLLKTSFNFDTMPIPFFNVFKSSSSPAIREALARLKHPPVYTDSVQPREEILRGGYAFLTYQHSLYEAFRRGYSDTERCSMGEIYLPMSVVRVGPMVPKGSPYTRVINYGLLKALQYGLTNRWKVRYLPQQQKCFHRFLPGDSIPFVSISVAVYVYLAGILLSTMLVVIEKNHSSS